MWWACWKLASLDSWGGGGSWGILRGGGGEWGGLRQIVVITTSWQLQLPEVHLVLLNIFEIPVRAQSSHATGK